MREVRRATSKIWLVAHFFQISEANCKLRDIFEKLPPRHRERQVSPFLRVLGVLAVHVWLSITDVYLQFLFEAEKVKSGVIPYGCRTETSSLFRNAAGLPPAHLA